MKGMILADLRKISLSKSTIVLLVITLVLPFISSMLYWAIENFAQQMISGQEIFFTYFAIDGGFAFIFSIFLALNLCSEFNHGTMRNKVLAGNTRFAIYGASFLSSSIYALVFHWASFFVNLVLTLLFFDWGVPFGGKEFVSILLFLLLTSFLMLLVVATTQFFSYLFRNIGLTICIFFAISFVLGLFQIVITSIAANGYVETAKFLTHMIPNFQTTNFLQYKGLDWFYTFLFDFLYISAFFVGGMFIFSRRDLK